MDWTPYILLGIGTVLSIAGFFFTRTMNTLSKHTVTLTQLVEQLRPFDKIANELIDLKVEHAKLKIRVDNNTEKLAQTVR